MRVCVCYIIYIYIHMHVNICVYAYIHIYIYYMYIYIYIYIYTYVYTYACIYLNVYIYICIWLFVCVCACVFFIVYLYTGKSKWSFSPRVTCGLPLPGVKWVIWLSVLPSHYFNILWEYVWTSHILSPSGWLFELSKKDAKVQFPNLFRFGFYLSIFFGGYLSIHN